MAITFSYQGLPRIKSDFRCTWTAKGIEEPECNDWRFVIMRTATSARPNATEDSDGNLYFFSPTVPHDGSQAIITADPDGLFQCVLTGVVKQAWLTPLALTDWWWAGVVLGTLAADPFVGLVGPFHPRP